MKKIDFKVAFPNFITILGLCLGLNSIKLAFEGDFEKSIIFIVIAAILDSIDGRIARLINGTSKFGAELDSLTDFVNFGVCPGLIIYFWSLFNIKFYGWIVSLIYIVACCLRLARFNLSNENYSKNDWKINFFSGVPAHAAAGLILLPIILAFSEFNYLYLKNDFHNLFIVVIVSFLMVSKIPTYAFKKVKITKNIFIILTFVFVLYFGLLFNKTFETLVITGVIYILSVPISFFNFIKLKKNYEKNIKKKDNDSIISDEIF